MELADHLRSQWSDLLCCDIRSSQETRQRSLMLACHMQNRLELMTEQRLDDIYQQQPSAVQLRQRHLPTFSATSTTVSHSTTQKYNTQYPSISLHIHTHIFISSRITNNAMLIQSVVQAAQQN